MTADPRSPHMTDGFEMLAEDHRTAERLFETCLHDNEDSVAREICEHLTTHTQLEEKVLYPALRRNVDDGDDLADQAEAEHATVKTLIARIYDSPPAGVLELVAELRRDVEHHVEREESKLFPTMRDSGVDAEDLGAAIESARTTAASSRTSRPVELRTREPWYRRALRGAGAGCAATVAIERGPVSRRVRGRSSSTARRDHPEAPPPVPDADPGLTVRVPRGVALHLAFGAASGALYGIVAPRRFREATATAAVGLIYTASYRGYLSTFGLHPHPERDDSRRQRANVAAHVVYGVVLAEIMPRDRSRRLTVNWHDAATPPPPAAWMLGARDAGSATPACDARRR